MRLPYGIKCKTPSSDVIELKEIEIISSTNEILIFKDGKGYGIQDVKPYLRSMNTLTEKENVEYQKVLKKATEIDSLSDVSNWFRSKHIDHVGFIIGNLALEAPKGMY